MKVRKKPVIVEAMQFKGLKIEGLMSDIDYAVQFDEWLTAKSEAAGVVCRYSGANLIIPTLEGDHTALPGDWIICGVKGELYPCKPDIFDSTYEIVDA